jgi:hypothetical protein
MPLPFRADRREDVLGRVATQQWQQQFLAPWTEVDGALVAAMKCLLIGRMVDSHLPRSVEVRRSHRNQLSRAHPSDALDPNHDLNVRRQMGMRGVDHFIDNGSHRVRFPGLRSPAADAANCPQAVPDLWLQDLVRPRSGDTSRGMRWTRAYQEARLCR